MGKHYGYDLGGSEYRVRGLACVDIQKPNDIELDLTDMAWSEHLTPTHHVNISKVLRKLIIDTHLSRLFEGNHDMQKVFTFCENLDKIILPYGIVRLFDCRYLVNIV